MNPDIWTVFSLVVLEGLPFTGDAEFVNHIIVFRNVYGHLRHRYQCCYPDAKLGDRYIYEGKPSMTRIPITLIEIEL